MTLRARVLAGTALVAVVLAALGLVILSTTRARMVDQVDDQLAGAVTTVGDVGFDFDHPAAEPGCPPGGDEVTLSSLYIGVVHGDGVTTEVKPDLHSAGDALPAVDAGRARDGAEDRTPFTTGATDGDQRYRALAYHDTRSDKTVVLALPLDAVDDTTTALLVRGALGGAVVVLTLGLVAWWVVHLGVRPVNEMTAAAATIAAGDLSHRVPETDPRTEAGRLGAALNQMLAQIEGAFAERTRSEARLRQFVADASHELHTPIATIRGYAELYRTGGLRDPGRLDDAQRRTEQEAVRMARIVDDLFDLAQLDEDRPLARDDVDLARLAADAAADTRAVEPDRPVVVDIADGPLVVVGDEGRLRQVLANLTTNALAHTPPGTPVEVRAHRRDGLVVVEVADRGPGMAPHHADRAFERFYRADPARSRRHGGSGLGLSIVAATVAAHHGTTQLDTAAGRGTTVRIELPAARS